MAIGGRFVVILVVLVFSEALSSYFDNMFWPSQIIATWGEPGVAFVIHEGMWGDLLILPFIFRYILNRHQSEWQDYQYVIMIFTGFAITLVSHLSLITTQEIPDPMGWTGQWFSLTIALHFFYMWAGMSVTGLFYFYSRASRRVVITISILLGLHVMGGMHVLMGIAERFGKWESVPDYLDTPRILYGAAFIWLALTLCARKAGGWPAAKAVFAAGCIFGIVTLTLLQFAP